VYAGSVNCSSAIVPTSSIGCLDTNPYWAGAMWRVATGQSQATFGDTNPDRWGTLPGTSGGPFGVTGAGLGPNFSCPAGGANCPTPLVSNYDYTTAQATTCTGGDGINCAIGPIPSAAAISADDSHNLWVLFGEGRYYNHQDKTNVDIMHFFGVKDDFISMGAGVQTTERNNLFNSSDVVVCSSCPTGSNVSTTGSTAVFATAFGPGVGSLLNSVQNSDGWFTTFNDPTAPFQTPPRSAMTPGERNTTTALVLGGTIFFTTFTPAGDICVAAGTGLLYAVFYQTGGPFTGSAVGESVAGGNTLVNKSLSLGQGMWSQANLHLGAQGTGATGTVNSGAGCVGRLTIYSQSSTGAVTGACGETSNPWSRMIAWRDL
jgi:Tfp pilus tip-associated adhesin PilY1